MADKIAEKYYSSNPSQLYYTINLIKILLQIFVHSNDSNLSLHPYASFLRKTKLTNPLYWKESIIKRKTNHFFLIIMRIDRDIFPES